jgi:phosphatidylserine/phosphatidylglycerophosphate/cardiolipin synthase-like enzyme
MMTFWKLKKYFQVAVFVTVPLFTIGAHAGELNSHNPEIYFSPHGGCTQAIVSQIRIAKSQILVQAYSFTSAPIASALRDAHHRGVHVEVILDKSQKKEKYTSATFLSNAGIPTYIDAAHAIAHNKIMILDKSTVITGSFNFTKAAEGKNAENLLIVKSPDIAKRYIDNWQAHRQHSEIYQARY